MTSYDVRGALRGSPMMSWPLRVSRCLIAPNSGVNPWWAMFQEERLVHMKTSPSVFSNAMYSMSGLTQQLVWPYMVSGRSVAATKNTCLPAKILHSQ